MSDKVIRHYSRPYGDCRADKRLYFGGEWPWQTGVECAIPPLSILGPRNIILATDGNFYVTSISTSKFYKITPTGIATLASDIIASPFNLTQASDSNIYICSDNDIYKYTLAGATTIFNSSVTAPTSIITASDTNLYCASDNSTGRLWQVTLAGVATNIATISGYIGNIVQKGDNLYFFRSISPGTRAVYKSTLSGTTTQLYTSTDDVQYGAALHSNGNIYYISYYTGKMYVLTFSGPSETEFTEFITIEYGLQNIIAHSNGNFYVTNYETNKLWQVTLAGVATVIATDLGHPAGLVEGADHNIYVCGSSSNKIWKITTAGVKTEFVP
jgi:hypothetical protein